MSRREASNTPQGLATRLALGPLRGLAQLARRWLGGWGPAGHAPESPHIRSGLVLAILGGWVLFLAASLAGLAWMAADVLHPAPASQSIGRFPEPELQTNARADLERLDAAQSERLNRTGWADRATARVEIPIGRAMDLVAAMGARAWQPLEAEAADTARNRAVNSAEQAQGRAP